MTTSPVGRHPDRGERLLVGLDRRSRVVGHEQDPVALVRGAPRSPRPNRGSAGARATPRRRGRAARRQSRRVVVSAVGRPSRNGGTGGANLRGVPRFEPFRALRYSADTVLDDAAAPPYDVLSERDVDALAAPARPQHRPDRRATTRRRPGSLRPRRGTTAGVGAGGDAACATSGPAFTLYRMRFRSEDGSPRETVGVIGALEVVDEGAGGVLPHERTTPKAKTDRLDLTRATERQPLAGVGAVTDGRSHGPAARARRGRRRRAPTTTACVHTVERVTDPGRVAAISAAVGVTSRPDRRRSPSLRDRTLLSRRAARRRRSRPVGPDARVRERARRGSAERRRDPPALSRRSRRRAARRAASLVRRRGGGSGRRDLRRRDGPPRRAVPRPARRHAAHG